MNSWLNAHREEDLAEGGQRSLWIALLRQLQQRFRIVPAKVRAQIEEAELRRSDAWLDRVIAAPDLKSVFD